MLHQMNLQLSFLHQKMATHSLLFQVPKRIHLYLLAISIVNPFYPTRMCTTLPYLIILNVVFYSCEHVHFERVSDSAWNNPRKCSHCMFWSEKCEWKESFCVAHCDYFKDIPWLVSRVLWCSQQQSPTYPQCLFAAKKLK